MQNNIQIFENEEFGKIEVLMIEGKPHFPATECAKVLGYKNPQKAVRDHCKGVNERFTPTKNQHGATVIQKVNFIPEGDVYRLIIRSKLPAAARFELWICDTVLPAIRQYGAYATPETLDSMQQDPEFTAGLICNLAKTYAKNRVLMDQVEALTPKALYCDMILQCDHSVPVTLIAKAYGMTAQAFNRQTPPTHKENTIQQSSTRIFCRT